MCVEREREREKREENLSVVFCPKCKTKNVPKNVDQNLDQK